MAEGLKTSTVRAVLSEGEQTMEVWAAIFHHLRDLEDEGLPLEGEEGLVEELGGVKKDVIGHGIGGINFPDIMAQLAKCKIAGVSDGRLVCHHPISRPVKSVMAKRSTYVDVMYYREFLTYRISTTSSIKVSYKLLVSHELLRSHYVRSRTKMGSHTRPIISWLCT